VFTVEEWASRMWNLNREIRLFARQLLTCSFNEQIAVVKWIRVDIEDEMRSNS
jgi:hypothetical protein